MPRSDGFRHPAAILVILGFLGSPALALEAGSLSVTGNVESQTLIRHPTARKLQLVQNRNVFRLRGEWDAMQHEGLKEAVPSSLLSSLRLNVAYRGVYDSFYDIAPGNPQVGQERVDDLVGGRIRDLSRDRRDALKFDNQLREAYVDYSAGALPINFRLGLQQVVWGESDYFRLMDLWNPLDLRWHLHQEPLWDEIRMPLWLLKGVWNAGDVGTFRDVFTEVVYNPGDYRPGILVDYLPRPWALPIPDPTRQGQVQYDPVTQAHYSPEIDLQGTSVRRGDFHRNPVDASEIGARLHFSSAQGIEVTTNYFYGRGRNIGASLPLALRIESVDVPALPGLGAEPIGNYQLDSGDPSEVRAVYPIHVKAKIVHPYLHVFGLTLKYFDADYTSTSYRMETAYVLGSPFQTIESEKLVNTTVRGRHVPALGLPTAPLGFTKRDVWSGMIGFDRPSMIESLNREAPWIFSGQFFWTHTLGRHADLLRGHAGVSEAPYFGPVGHWVDGPFAGRSERQQNSRQVGNGDTFRRWEHLLTLSAMSSYRNSTLVPVFAGVFDPVNINFSFLWSVDYFLTNELILTLRQAFYTDFAAKVPSNDPWLIGGRLHRRDETGIKLTYQF
jgi:hypothetical protein